MFFDFLGMIKVVLCKIRGSQFVEKRKKTQIEIDAEKKLKHSSFYCA